MLRKRISQWVWFLLASVLIFEQAHAADSHWYIVPGMVYIAPDSDRHTEDDIGLQMGIGKTLSPSVALEWNWMKNQLEPKEGKVGVSKFEQSGWSLDGIRVFKPVETLSTYLLIGIGTLKTESNVQQAYRPIIQVGMGIMRPFWGSDRITLRADLRYRIDEGGLPPESRYGDGIVHLGLILPLEKNPESAPVTPSTTTRSAPAPMTRPQDIKDTDGDGVSDGSDDCPKTPTGTPVNDIGC